MRLFQLKSLFVFLIMGLSACTLALTEDALQDEFSQDKPLNVSKVRRNGRGENELYRVSLLDLEAYFHLLDVLENNDHLQVTDYRAYPNQDDVLFYAVDFEKGWQILSADKRGPLILAQCPEGSFSEAIDNNPSLMTWVGSLAEDILTRRELDEKYGKTLVTE